MSEDPENIEQVITRLQDICERAMAQSLRGTLPDESVWYAAEKYFFRLVKGLTESAAAGDLPGYRQWAEEANRYGERYVRGFIGKKAADHAKSANRRAMTVSLDAPLNEGEAGTLADLGMGASVAPGSEALTMAAEDVVLAQELRAYRMDAIRTLMNALVERGADAEAPGTWWTQRMRECVEAYFFGDESGRQVAQRLGVTPGTVTRDRQEAERRLGIACYALLALAPPRASLLDRAAVHTLLDVFDAEPRDSLVAAAPAMDIHSPWPRVNLDRLIRLAEDDPPTARALCGQLGVEWGGDEWALSDAMRSSIHSGVALHADETAFATVAHGAIEPSGAVRFNCVLACAVHASDLDDIRLELT